MVHGASTALPASMMDHTDTESTPMAPQPNNPLDSFDDFADDSDEQGAANAVPCINDDDHALRSPVLHLFQKSPKSFVPLQQRANSIAEVTYLVPSSTCTTRQATIMSATFNMTATIVGGGVLSIPLACARAGVVPFTVLMIMAACATDLSLYLLVSCSRRCGSTSFGGVSRRAFGPGLEFVTTCAAVLIVGCLIIFI